MITKPIGLYIHVPFCLRKCAYCDFCSFPIDSVLKREEYISSLCLEIEGYKNRGISVNSIFFGGGTPSLLTTSEIEKIVSFVRKTFSVCDDLEFTIEANPKTLSKEKLYGLIGLGVNRLSIGLQSIHENELKMLGRIHSYKDFVEMFLLAREVGFDNINVDFMYGIPGQTKESFENTLSTIMSLSPEHISLYGLILEEGTPLYDARESMTFPSEDTECDMYYYAANFLRKHGYSHYEISNYAREGRECAHNLKYWRCEEYIGFGLSAYSYFDGKRYGNTNKLDEYLSGNYLEYDSVELTDLNSSAYEYVMLGLRLKEGISLSEYSARFGKSFLVGREEVVEKFIDSGYLKQDDDRLYLTDQGMYISNYILNELI